MMDIDPLGHAILPKFCSPSTIPFYGLGSAGSSYSAASLSAGSRSSVEVYSTGGLHDPLSRHAVSTESYTPGHFVHPKPIKVEPQPAPRRQEDIEREEDKRQEACEALHALKTEPVREETKMETAEGVKEETKETTEETESSDEPSPKRAKNISYQCCSCDFTSAILSSLTSHLEAEHGLTDYELIKSLLSCLGDIGA